MRHSFSLALCGALVAVWGSQNAWAGSSERPGAAKQVDAPEEKAKSTGRMASPSRVRGVKKPKNEAPSPSTRTRTRTRKQRDADATKTRKRSSSSAATSRSTGKSSATSSTKSRRAGRGSKAASSTKRFSKKPTCLNPAVTVVRGKERSTFALTTCDGQPAPLAIDRLSILARPGNADVPETAVEVLASQKGAYVSPGIRRIEPRLVQQLWTTIEHFSGASDHPTIYLVSGYRPSGGRSYHARGRALDFAISGVKNESLVDFCKTFDDTGCGYYPNSTFIHMDAREKGIGHISWIDASGPGEPPRYVSAWPPPKPAPEAGPTVDDPAAIATAIDPAPEQARADASDEPLPDLPVPDADLIALLGEPVPPPTDAAAAPSAEAPAAVDVSRAEELPSNPEARDAFEKALRLDDDDESES